MNSWALMVLHGVSWVFMGLHGFAWVFMDFQGSSGDIMRCFVFVLCLENKMHFDFENLWTEEPRFEFKNCGLKRLHFFKNHWVLQPKVL